MISDAIIQVLMQLQMVQKNIVWEMGKTAINNDKVEEIIKAIEDGKESHIGGNEKKCKS